MVIPIVILFLDKHYKLYETYNHFHYFDLTAIPFDKLRFLFYRVVPDESDTSRVESKHSKEETRNGKF